MSEDNACGDTISKKIQSKVTGTGDGRRNIPTPTPSQATASSESLTENTEWENISLSSKATSKSQRSSASSKGEIIVLPNGKKVRRVKKSESKKYREMRETENQHQNDRYSDGLAEPITDTENNGKKEDRLITTMTLGAVPESIPFVIKEENENVSPRSSHQADYNGKSSPSNKDINAVKVDWNHENNERVENEEVSDKEAPASYEPPVAPPLPIIEVRSYDEQDISLSHQESKSIPTTPRQTNPSEIKTSFHHHHMTSQQQSNAPMKPEQPHRVVNFPNSPTTPPPTSPRNNIESTIKMKKTQISQSLLARTRSRAEVEALSPINGRDRNAEERNPLSNKSPTGRSDETLFLKPNLAKKRTKVVQLLVFGLLGIVGGFFGSIFVQSTCNFANAILTVGQYDNSFKVHLGLWKYSPIDSVFQGYSYCWPYDDSYASRGPILARITGLIGLISGSIALGVLWVYLIVGVTNEFFWTGAVKVLIFTGICQLLTFTFFLDKVCSEAHCYFGPGAFICLICTIIWFVVAYEMHNNAPVSALLPFLPTQSEKNDLMNLELPEMHERIKSAWNRLPFKAAQEEVPSLSTFTKKNQCDRYERMVNDNDSSCSSTSNDNNSQGSYVPPTMNGVV